MILEKLKKWQKMQHYIKKNEYDYLTFKKKIGNFPHMV